MFFRQILHDDLGCASHLIADGGEAAVIDAKWEIEEYLQLADENDFQITSILETHNHADHVSGRGRLHEATGATIHVSADAGIAYEHEPLREGETVSVGKARIRAFADHRIANVDGGLKGWAKARLPLAPPDGRAV